MPPSSPTRVRYLVVAVTALMAVLLYLDRFCISFAEVFIKEDLGLTDSQVGWMLSAFFWTYALSQVPSGWLTDRFGPRLMLTSYVLGWSLLTGLTGVAAGFGMLILLRLGFGIAQAGAYPTGASLIGRWMPVSARATASSLVSVGGRVGGWLALFASGPLIVWLTPAATPATLRPRDLLDVPRFCYELSAPGGDADVAAVVNAKILNALPTTTRSAVSDCATAYRAERNAETERRKAPGQGRAGGADVVPLAAPPGLDAGQLTADLNGMISRRGFFRRAAASSLPLEREARRLLAQRPEELDERQVQRLNRLILEAAHRDTVRRLYGAGWRPMMFVYGCLGLAVAALVWWTCRNHPADHTGVNDAERSLIENRAPATPPLGSDVQNSIFAGTESSTGQDDGPRKLNSVRLTPDPGQGRGAPAAALARLAASLSLWLLSASQLFTNVGWVFIVTWAPRYFQSVHQLPVEERALLVSIPPLVGWFGTVLGGLWTDYLLRTMGLRWSRSLPIGLSRLLAVGAYLGFLFEPSPWGAVVLFSLVAFLTDWSQGTVWAFCQDIGGRQTASVLGWTNMWGNFGAAVTPPLLIWIIGPSQNWMAAFLACAAAFLLAGLTGLAIDATKPLAAGAGQGGGGKTTWVEQVVLHRKPEK
ncbi:MAG: MFS transporter [Candidatus Anammoximicrobium sp.]|nr:MFS transporter [Candidatus Anammoximicrobium sp.]